MADIEPTTFDPAFVEAMKRVEAKRLMPEKRKMLSRLNPPLMARGMVDSNFAIYNFVGWVHTGGALREKPKARQ